MGGVLSHTLRGHQLNYAVALAENILISPTVVIVTVPPGEVKSGPIPDFCNTCAGDHIIDRECISTVYIDGRWTANTPSCQVALGRTRREAALRAWVIFKIGRWIEIPEGGNHV